MKRRLLEAIDDMADYLNKASRWYDNGQEPFGHIVSNSQESYIYEFYCYMRFIKDINSNGTRIIFNNRRSKDSLFPKAPAEKRLGWAKFDIINKDGVILYDVNGGTIIHHSEITNYSFAPDISIQKPGDDPNEDSVMHIVDAKYKTDTKEELHINQLREFKACIDDFKLPKEINGLEIENTCFKLSTIVTNGVINTRHNPYATENNFQQIGNFIP